MIDCELDFVSILDEQNCGTPEREPATSAHWWDGSAIPADTISAGYA